MSKESKEIADAIVYGSALIAGALLINKQGAWQYHGEPGITPTEINNDAYVVDKALWGLTRQATNMVSDYEDAKQEGSL